MRDISIDQGLRLAIRALQNGASLVKPRVIEWDISGGCHDPYRVSLHARPEGHKLLQWGWSQLDAKRRLGYVNHREAWVRGSHAPIFIDLDTPCRRCPRCLARRRKKWLERCQLETAAAYRTWFGTITLSPSNHHYFLEVARNMMTDKGIDFDTLCKTKQFRARCSAIGVELTKWLKRIRKSSGALIRYCLVAERHKTGLPHFHILVHQCHDVTITKRQLQDAWRLGHSHFKLVAADDGASHYVSKYVGKDASARIRASRSYGTPSRHSHLQQVACTPPALPKGEENPKP